VALPATVRVALAALPAVTRRELLASMPAQWHRPLLVGGIAGDEPTWVVAAVDQGALSVTDAAHALEGLTHDQYEALALELVRRGLDPALAVEAMEAGADPGDDAPYESLLLFCGKLAGRSDPGLVAIGNAGLERFGTLR
jgi:hypothetical protein